MLLIWKEYFMHANLSFSSPRCAIIDTKFVIYTKFRRAMIARLNKIWRVWACARAITRQSWPGLSLVKEQNMQIENLNKNLTQHNLTISILQNNVEVLNEHCSKVQKDINSKYDGRVGTILTSGLSNWRNCKTT